MTHGNITMTVGTCRTCGRGDVELDDRDMCVDEFSCAAAWVRRRVAGGAR